MGRVRESRKLNCGRILGMEKRRKKKEGGEILRKISIENREIMEGVQ